MRQEIVESHKTDENGNPTGGESLGTGININWQNGPLGRGTERIPPTGAFVEGVISAALGRLKHYQNSKFKCDANENAIWHLEQALCDLDGRTKEREDRQVEGTHMA